MKAAPVRADVLAARRGPAWPDSYETLFNQKRLVLTAGKRLYDPGLGHRHKAATHFLLCGGRGTHSVSNASPKYFQSRWGFFPGIENESDAEQG